MKVYLFSAMSVLALLEGTPARAAEFSGPRIEVHAGWDHPDFSARSGHPKSTDDGILYGAGAGYDVALGRNLIAGVEGNFDLSTAQSDTRAGATFLERRFKWDFDVGARVGAVVTPGVLLYAKAGYSGARRSDRISATGTTGTTVTRIKQTIDGLRLGVGVEYKIVDGIFAKTEYRFSSYKGNEKRHQVIAGVGVRF